jgi:tetratricopeptide (TPR) repeat protein
MLGEYDAAVTALEKYVAIDPSEANPHDSLGEVLLMAGRFDEAEAAFTKSTEVNPAFWPGFSGIAQSRFLRGDWEGGRTALGKAIGAAALPEDRVDIRTHLAWSSYAQGDRAQAATTLAEAETEATGANLHVSYAWVALDRGHMATLSGEWGDAITQSREGLARAETAKLEGGELLYVRLASNLGQVIGLSMQGKTADAEALLGPIDIDASLLPGAVDFPLVAKGAVAVGKGDTAAAIASYAKCEARDAFCMYMLVKAHEKAGDTAAAEAARDKLLSLNQRGGEYLGIWAASGGPTALAAVTSGQ